MNTAEDDDDYQFKTRQPTAVTKRKGGKNVVVKPLDARQYTMFIGSCFLISWGLVATVLLLQLGILYTFDICSLTRQEYVSKGTAEWAKKVVTQEVMQTFDVWNLINASIVGLVYRQPQDFAKLGSILSPAFETVPMLHSVDFAFSDRTSEVTVLRKKGEGIRISSTSMQSNSHDCFLMGVDGCEAQESGRPEWYEFGTTLMMTAYGGVFYWAQKPDLVVESSPDGNGDILSPAVRLIFKTVFPEHFTPDGKNTEVIGRITLKVATLSGDRLVDDAIGKKGAIYLVDATGAMLAARESGDLLMVDDGIIRYKNFWEVGPDWGNRIKSAFTGSSVKEIISDSGGTLAVVEPCDYPLGRFAVIAVTKEWGPFQNAPLIGTSALASIVAPAPYVITGTLAFFFFWIQCFHTMRTRDGKVGADFAPQKRLSVSATMNRISMSGPRKSMFTGLEQFRAGQGKGFFGRMKALVKKPKFG